MTDDLHVQRADELVAFGAAVAEAGLLASTCGNASLRLDEDHIVVTASGSSLAALRRDDIAVVRVADAGAVQADGPRPSMETDLHCRAYRVRLGVGAVLHCQSRAATLVACMREPPSSLDFIPEIPAYVRAWASVPYGDPGSAELARDVERALAEDDDVTVVQMVNHGQVIVGESWRTVMRRAQFFELACWLATQGHALSTIPADSVERLRDYGRPKRR